MPPRGLTRRRALATIGLVGAGSVINGIGHDRRYGQRLLAAADPVAEQFGLYTAYQLSMEEYVGRVALERGRTGLTDRGYRSNPLAAAKYHPVNEDLDDRSLRRIDPDAARWQWHVHLWRDGNGYAEVFSHYELRPDVKRIGDESFDEMAERVHSHYQPKWDTTYDADEATYFLGRTCDEVDAILRRNDGA